MARTRPMLFLVAGGAPRAPRNARRPERPPHQEVARLEAEVRELQELLGRKTYEVELLREALDRAHRAGFHFTPSLVPRRD